MKKCKYCGNVITETERYCSSCGGNQFTFICANCGNEFENGLHCPRCGIKVGQAEKICPKCGNHYFTNACSNCGYTGLNSGMQQQPVNTTPMYVQPQQQVVVQNTQNGKPKNKTVALLLCLFLGFYGAHKFYEGNIGMGIVYLFTAGLFLIGWIIDIFIILAKPSTYYV